MVAISVTLSIMPASGKVGLTASIQRWCLLIKNVSDEEFMEQRIFPSNTFFIGYGNAPIHVDGQLQSEEAVIKIYNGDARYTH